jgi:hypothetical protein
MTKVAKCKDARPLAMYMETESVVVTLFPRCSYAPQSPWLMSDLILRLRTPSYEYPRMEVNDTSVKGCFSFFGWELDSVMMENKGSEPQGCERYCVSVLLYAGPAQAWILQGRLILIGCDDQDELGLTVRSEVEATQPTNALGTNVLLVLTTDS